ncbi:MAG: 16S rRNA (adenine(1518)-N(6)/adenine(1519)-N(6))-dimethyltransferase RsmA [Woeseiaceae bacterium]|nr:16S rRNA (adenine(1518)-N(6)/adenine(1519)-N(6))-dimethyltransferase RsmA [Woeseiaceae bacterium]
MSPPRPRKRFGQHFLRDPGVIEAILDAIAPAPGDTLVEIGPGRGVLTDRLAPAVAALHAIEIDRDLAAMLVKRFAGQDTVTIHEADALAFDFGALGTGLRIVGNLPYNISTPLLFHLLEYRQHIADMHFMLQKEVVERMAADPGSRTYGRLTVMLGCRFAVEALFDVDPLAFEPPPAVDSAVVRLTPLPADVHRIADPALFKTVVAAAFGQRRKTLRNALRNLADEGALEAAGIDPGLRAEALAVERFVALANHLAASPDPATDRATLR